MVGELQQSPSFSSDGWQVQFLKSLSQVPAKRLHVIWGAVRKFDSSRISKSYGMHFAVSKFSTAIAQLSNEFKTTKDIIVTYN